MINQVFDQQLSAVITIDWNRYRRFWLLPGLMACLLTTTVQAQDVIRLSGTPGATVETSFFVSGEAPLSASTSGEIASEIAPEVVPGASGTINYRYEIPADAALNEQIKDSVIVTDASQFQVTFAIEIEVRADAFVSPALPPRRNTPEDAAAAATETACQELSSIANRNLLSNEQRNLLETCNNLDDGGLVSQNTLRQLSPSAQSSLGRSGQDIAGQQMNNLATRLLTLRRGARGFSVAGLNMEINDERLPGEVLALLLENGGGGAGDDAAGDVTALGGRLGGFINGSFLFGDRDDSAQEDGFDFNTLGVTGGVDYRLTEQLILGAALGYTRVDVDPNNNRGDVDVDGFNLAAYGNYYPIENLYIDGVVGYGRYDYHINRNIRFALADAAGNLVDSVDTRTFASTDSDQYSVSVGTGYRFNFPQGLAFDIDGRLSYLKLDIDGYNEKGAGERGLNLEIDDQSWQSFTSTLGGSVSKVFSMNWGVLIPLARFEWEHEFENDAENVSFRYSAALSNQFFSFETESFDSDYFRVGIGASAVFAQGRSAFLFYDTTLGQSRYTDHYISAGLRLEF